MRHPPAFRTCAFCNDRFPAGRGRGEDIVPRWYAKHHEHPTTGEVVVATFDQRNGRLTTHRARRTQTVAAAELRLADVCIRCNNGWMSQVERAAKPVLLSLIDGTATALTAASQRVVAAWAQMTTLTEISPDLLTETPHL